MQSNWNYPTQIAVGYQRLFELPNYLDQHRYQMVFIVVDSFIKQQDYYNLLQQKLIDSNISITVFDSFQGNPSDQDIDNGIALLKQSNHDCILALGGGSALDVAKTLALVAKQSAPLWDFEDLADNYQRADEALILPIIAVPTTAGTGSEVGRASVITDSQAKTKRLIFHPKMLPCYVILDPLVTLTVPPALTAATAMDAFAHNLEAYLAPGYHPMADGIALEGMRLIKENVLTAFRNGQNIEARTNLLVASTMGATAFQKGLGVIHALSHPVGAMFDKHHGMLNALFMPYSLKFNRAAIEDKCQVIASYLGLAQANFDGLLQYITELIHLLELPLSLAAIGIDETHLEEIIDKALVDPSAATNPIPLNQENLREVLTMALKGE